MKLLTTYCFSLNLNFEFSSHLNTPKALIPFIFLVDLLSVIVELTSKHFDGMSAVVELSLLLKIRLDEFCGSKDESCRSNVLSAQSRIPKRSGSPSLLFIPKRKKANQV